MNSTEKWNTLDNKKNPIISGCFIILVEHLHISLIMSWANRPQ